MSDDNVLIVIPARMAASRLPGKPMADINGEPMIVHVWRRAMAAQLGWVLVATDSEEIAGAVRSAGGEARLSLRAHENGSSRVEEALEGHDPERRIEVVVNLQGDLPTIAPQSIRACLAPLGDGAVDIATLATEITREEERDNPNVVKIAGSPVGPSRLRALYFSRARIPSGPGPHYHHIGIYAYRRAALERYVRLPPSPLEMQERLEQLRALEAGMRIDAAIVDAVPLGVDTPADLERARALLAR
ncbi:MAG: 3-deoxy-manno-octulosonate cytidylyltransferase [Bauldia sp.]|nr:3-deoxy-manno-octulosonate cytidylyltransferase [Bauldia sp.]